MVLVSLNIYSAPVIFFQPQTTFFLSILNINTEETKYSIKENE